MNRAMRRIRHRLIPVPHNTRLGIQGFRLGPGQKMFTCICGSGWLSISSALPQEAFTNHIATFLKTEEARVATQP